MRTNKQLLEEKEREPTEKVEEIALIDYSDSWDMSTSSWKRVNELMFNFRDELLN